MNLNIVWFPSVHSLQVFDCLAESGRRRLLGGVSIQEWLLSTYAHAQLLHGIWPFLRSPSSGGIKNLKTCLKLDAWTSRPELAMSLLHGPGATWRKLGDCALLSCTVNKGGALPGDSK